MYIESLLFIDFWVNLIILLATSLILKKKVYLFNITLSSLIGTISVLILFLNITKIQTLILKTYFSVLMILIAFGYKDFFKKLIIFYFLNFILGGAIYAFKIKNVFFLFILSPIIIYIYIRSLKKNNLFFDVEVHIKNKILFLKGFLDSGNSLFYNKKMVIITNIKNEYDNNIIYVPYITVSGTSVLKCINVDKVIVNSNTFNNVLLGFSDFKLKGADVLLNKEMGE